MGQKALIRLLVIFAVVGVIALIVKLAGPGKVETISNTTEREKVFPDFPINDVAKVRIKSISGEVNLEKTDQGWAVAERDDFPADADQTVEFLRNVWDLKIVQSPEIGESQYNRLSLIDPSKGANDNSATVVSFLNGEGKELASLWLGKVVERDNGQASPFGGMSSSEAGRYVKTGDEAAVHLVSETFSKIETDPSDWLNDQKFFKVDKVKSIAIQTGNAADDWKLTREEENGDFTLVGAKPEEELDPVKVGSMKNAFSNPRFEDVIVGEEAKEKSPNKTTFVIQTFDGFTYTVKLGEKTDLNEYFLTYDVTGKFQEKRKPGEEESDEEKKKLDDEFNAHLKELTDKLDAEKAMAGKVFKVRSYVADSLIKKRDEILKKEEADASAGGAPKPPAFTPGSAPPAALNNAMPAPGAPAGVIADKPQAPKPPVPAPGAKGEEVKKPKIEKPAPAPAAEKPKTDAPKPAEKKESAPAPKPEAKPAPKTEAKTEASAKAN
ncbi:MAG: DUF4340 domain-containing protein [Verrucomicrobiae bacterium]|nr:DUF4340 domain-containing protein [Verrucomicrobiae bacterium]